MVINFLIDLIGMILQDKSNLDFKLRGKNHLRNVCAGKFICTVQGER